MYPFVRMAWQFWEHRKAPGLGLSDVHVSHHRCWPWDIDFWVELNNGRTLTLYDLGRIPLANRTGLTRVLREEKWGLTVAGVSVRYRKRITPMTRFEMRSRCLGFDDRFLYIDQSMWKGETCLNQALYRTAVTSTDGIVAPDKVTKLLGFAALNPELPAWVQHWIDAENTRPWPPEIG